MLLLCCEATQISCENCHFPNRAVNVKKNIYIVYNKEQILVCNLSFLNIFVTFSIKTYKLYDSCALFCALSYKNQGLATITINNWHQTVDSRQPATYITTPKYQQKQPKYSMCAKIKLFSLISTNWYLKLTQDFRANNERNSTVLLYRSQA